MYSPYTYDDDEDLLSPYLNRDPEKGCILAHVDVFLQARRTEASADG